MSTLLLQREMGEVKGDAIMHELWNEGLEQKMFFSRKEEENSWKYAKFVYVKKLRATILGKETLGVASGHSQMAAGRGYCASAMKINSDATIPAEVFEGWPIDLPLSTQEVKYQASAANPYSGDTSFAVATSNGATIAFVNEANSTMDASTKSSDTSDVGDVDWKDANTVIQGCEDGLVRLWDLRSGGEVMRLQHPSPVNYAKRIVDENRIIVAGLQSQLWTYDLRSTSEAATPGQVTKPCHKFPTYKNLELSPMAVGFDVHGGLFAAATEDGRVILGDGNSGRVLTEEEWTHASCLRFVHDEMEAKALRLMGTAKRSVIELAW
ncbi:MAG: hypothetical protein Q9161_004211 [Pseudevernia consocians]